MKKLNLMSGGKRLTKEQMKKINGGVAQYTCYALNSDGSRGTAPMYVGADNGCEAQALADWWAYSGNTCCGVDCDYPGEECD